MIAVIFHFAAPGADPAPLRSAVDDLRRALGAAVGSATTHASLRGGHATVLTTWPDRVTWEDWRTRRRERAFGTVPYEAEVLDPLPPDGAPTADRHGEDAEVRALLEANSSLAALSRENIRARRELERTRRQLERTLEELHRSYWHLEKIQEVLPICMQCGRVKAGSKGWQSVVDYLRENALFLSHGYCPDCRAQLAPKQPAKAD